MTKLIALRNSFIDEVLTSWDSYLSFNLKQEALLFDQIGILGLSQLNEILDSSRNDQKILNQFVVNKLEPIIMELQWLTENEIVFELNMEKEFGEQEINNYFSNVNSKYDVEEILKLSTKLVETGEIVDNIKNKAELVELIKASDAIVLRLMSLMMGTTKGITAVTTLPYTEYVRELPNSNKSEVAQIVIRKLPLPNNETPWEQIIDYRNDSENQKNLLILRRWIRKVSSENLPPIEIEEELEWLMNEFQSHMKLHKMKANTETLEVMVKAPLEIIENLIKLKLSKIPEPLFALKKRQINLMEAELNAPGREMAYIIKTRDTFQS